MPYLREKTRKETTNNLSSSLLARKLISFFSLVVIGFALPGSLFLVNLAAQFQPHAARATGNTIYASPGDNLTTKVSALQPGDTLLLNDGVYYAPLNVVNKVGTATAPITIKA